MIKRNVLSLSAGALLPFAFAPFYIFPLAWISPALLLYLWLDQPPQRAALQGGLFGFGFFGIGVPWIYISIHDYGDTSVLLAGFFSFLFLSILSAYFVVQGYLLARFFPKTNLTKLFCAFPASWVLFEWIRAWFLSGFSWLLLCHSQTLGPLKGYIPVLGPYGTSFIVAFFAALWAYLGLSIWHRAFKKLMATILIMILMVALGQGLSKIAWTSPIGAPLTVSLIQGNIEQDLKWRKETVRTTLDLYTSLTYQHFDSDLIIWPEAAIPVPMHYVEGLLEQLNHDAQIQHTALVLGVPVAVPAVFSYYNGLVVVGQGTGHYYKKHLVPFGEYVPFDQWLRGLIAFFDLPMSQMTPGPLNQSVPFAREHPFAAFICYEIAIPSYLYHVLPQAQFLVVLSNDAWFGKSWAQAQHLQIGQFAALASGRPLLFSSNNGLTAVLDPKGNITAQIAPFETGVLTTSFQPMQGLTPASYLGVWPFAVGFGLMLSVLLFRFRTR